MTHLEVILLLYVLAPLVTWCVVAVVLACPVGRRLRSAEERAVEDLGLESPTWFN